MAEKGSTPDERLKGIKARGVDAQRLRRQARTNVTRLRKEKRSELFLKKRVGTLEDLEPTDPSSTFDEISLQRVLSSCMSADRMEILEGMRQLSTMLCSAERNAASRDQVIKADTVVQRLVECLGGKNGSEFQFEAARLITYIAAGSSEHTRVVVEWNALPVLVELLSSTTCVQQYALLALGNIANDCEDFRYHVPIERVVHTLFRLLQTSKDVFIIKNGLFCLSQLNQRITEYSSGVQFLLYDLLVEHADTEVLSDICSTLKVFLEDEQYKIFMREGVCQKLVGLLRTQCEHLLQAALCVVEKMLSEDDVQIAMFLDCSLLSALQHLLRHNGWLHEETCAVLSCITTSKHIQAVIDAGLFRPLGNVLRTGTFRAKVEAVYVIQSAIASCSHDQTSAIVQSGCMANLGDLLDSCYDNDTIHIVLCTISNVLCWGAQTARGGPNVYAQEVEGNKWLEKIDKLQDHENDDISSTAIEIMFLYFSSDD